MKVSNGTLGTITAIRTTEDLGAELTVKADDGRLLSFLVSDYADEKGTYLCHAYALTVYSSQGTTVDGNTFVYGDAGMNRVNSYVSLSRHKDESNLYFSRKSFGISVEEKLIFHSQMESGRDSRLASDLLIEM